MTAAWMLYCGLCALGLAVAAALIERALIAGRAPVRFVWIAAVALSVIIPAAAFQFSPRTVVLASDARAGQSLDDLEARTAMRELPPGALPSTPMAAGWDWRRAMARLDRPLSISWIILSLAITINFLGGILVLAWMRRGWERRKVLGVSVLVSPRTGPAVVGALSPAIVIPEWALALEPRQLSLMLRHEQEHRRAGDGRLLTMAQLALAVMPWNVALWWQVLRLRVAVELDCDARVLREADARSYGDLLLEVARPRRGLAIMGVTAFAERATQLERRIRLLARHRANTSRAARMLASTVAILTVATAWVSPRPPVPARMTAPAAAPAVPPRMASERAPQPVQPARVSALDSGPRVTRPRPAVQDPPLVDSAFNRLFAGIELSSGQVAQARAFLVTLLREQAALDAQAREATWANASRIVSVRTERDSALRALLTSDADRAALDAALMQRPGGGRGRSGTPRSLGARSPDPMTGLLDSLFPGAAGGTARVEIRGRVRWDSARGGGPRESVFDLRARVNDVSPLIAAASFNQLFSGITLTPEQEAEARKIILKAQQQVMPIRPQPEVRLRLRPGGGVTMRAPSDSLLLSIITNDADRATVRSRVVVIRP